MKKYLAICCFASTCATAGEPLMLPMVGEYPGLAEPPANQAQWEWHGHSSKYKWGFKRSPLFDSPEQACQYSASIRRPRDNGGWTLGNNLGVWTTPHASNHIEASSGWRQVVGTTDRTSLTCKVWSMTYNRWLLSDYITRKSAPQSCQLGDQEKPFPIQFWVDAEQEYLPVLFIDSGKYYIEPGEWPLTLGYYPDGVWDQAVQINIDDHCEPLDEQSPAIMVCTPRISYQETINGLEYWSTPHRGRINYRVVGAANGAVHTEGCVEFK